MRNINLILFLEGGESNSVYDHGGHTKYGITENTYNRRQPSKSFADLDKEGAKVFYRDIYLSEFKELPQGVALDVLTSFVVHTGHRRAVKKLQKALNRVRAKEKAPYLLPMLRKGSEPLVVDGDWGPSTRKAYLAAGDKVVAPLVNAIRLYYKAITRKMKKGKPNNQRRYRGPFLDRLIKTITWENWT